MCAEHLKAGIVLGIFQGRCGGDQDFEVLVGSICWDGKVWGAISDGFHATAVVSVSFEKTAASSSILIPIRQVEEKLIELLVASWGGVGFDRCLGHAQSLWLHIDGCMLSGGDYFQCFARCGLGSLLFCFYYY